MDSTQCKTGKCALKEKKRGSSVLWVRGLSGDSHRFFCGYRTGTAIEIHPTAAVKDDDHDDENPHVFVDFKLKLKLTSSVMEKSTVN